MTESLPDAEAGQSLGVHAQPPRHPEVVVVGCGNPLRGDDALGSAVIHELFERGLGAKVMLVDGGTGGMDVAFKLRGARKAVLVDAARVEGLDPGTIMRVPGEAVAHLPPLEELHSHSFRWDHALAFARWLLKEEYPSEVVVFLAQGANYDLGAPLSGPMERALAELVELIESEVLIGSEPPTA